MLFFVVILPTEKQTQPKNQKVMFKKKERKMMNKEKNQEENTFAALIKDAPSKSAEEQETREEEAKVKEPEAVDAEDSVEKSGEESVEESAEEATVEENRTGSGTADPVEQAYCLGAGIDDETLAKAKALLNKIADAVVCNKFDPEVLQTAFKILSYEETMDKIRKEAFATGRAEKMAEALRTKREKAEEAEAIPQMGGMKNAGVLRGGSIFEVARGA